MFETQEIKITASSIEDFTDIVIGLVNAGLEFEEQGKYNRYTINADHDELLVRLFLYKDFNDNTEED